MFAENAQKYWEKGISVLPLVPRQKNPIIQGWSRWCKELPPAEVRDAWLETFTDENNIGLAMGEASGLVGIDLDTEDPVVRQVLEDILPFSPWERVGAKGYVRLFRYSGERTFRLKGRDGRQLFELLSQSTQIVLPPSIHPKTQLPYTANCELLDVLDRFLPLPADFEELARSKLIAAGVDLETKGVTRVTDWVPAGARDNQMVRMAGLMALGVLRSEHSLVEAMDRMTAWAENLTEKVAGDTVDVEKARYKVIEFLRRDVMERKKLLPKGWDAYMSAEEVIKAREALGDVEDAWTLEDFLTYFNEEVKPGDGDDVRQSMELINSVLTRVATNQQLSEVDVEMVLKKLHEAVRKQVSIAVIRRQLKSMTSGGDQNLGESHAEIANMLLEDLKEYGEIRFHNGRLHQWVGSHFETMEEYTVTNLLVGRYGNLPAARRHSDHKGILRTLESLTTQPLREEDEKGINFANGFLTPDMQLLPHQPRYGCTYVLPYRYMVDHPAPLKFFQFLEDCWSHEPDYAERVEALREVIAVMLFGYARTPTRCVCLFGRAKTGKSVLADVLMGLCSESAISYVPPQDWADRFKPVQMDGKLLNFCGELSETKFIPGEKFKSIVSGETMSGEYKGQQVFTFRPECMHLFCSNHLPKSPDYGLGFGRRWLFLTFSKVVPTEKVNANLARQILDEDREGIACWAVGAIGALLARSDFKLFPSHMETTMKLLESLNSVLMFMNGGEVKQTGDVADQVSENDMYMAYYSYCRLQANKPAFDLSKFKAAMEEMTTYEGARFNYEHGPQGGTYTGVKLTRGA